MAIDIFSGRKRQLFILGTAASRPTITVEDISPPLNRVNAIAALNYLRVHGKLKIVQKGSGGRYNSVLTVYAITEDGRKVVACEGKPGRKFKMTESIYV